MGGGPESRCVGRAYGFDGSDGAVARHQQTVKTCCVKLAFHFIS